MIKNLKRNDTQVTPFVATKDWTLSNVTNEALILLDHTGSNGEDLAISWERIVYGDGSYPYTASRGAIALDQQDADSVIYQEGVSGSGIFYPNSEPTNLDGTYKRLVYTMLKNMFYNDYKDPTKLWGMENLDINLDGVKRFIGQKIRSFMVPRINFGEKILENSVRLTDNSLDNEYTIADDGNSNLFAETNLFSRVQEIGMYGSFPTGGYSGYCDFFVIPSPPLNPINLSGYFLSGSITSSGVYLTWDDAYSTETEFRIYRTSGSAPYQAIGSVVANVINYIDSDIPSSGIYDYYVTAINFYGESSASNIATIISADPWNNDVWQNLVDNWENYSGVLWS
jgi:hypothetical protein